MKGAIIAASLLASVALALTPAVSAICGDAYPAEPGKRGALDACAQADPGFHRLIAEDRARCYARQLQAAPQPDPVPRSLEIVESATPRRLAL